MNNVQKYVVSDSLSDDERTQWSPTTIIRRDELVQKVNELRAQPGGDINIMGSATVAKALLANDLVDELDLMIEPIVLGGGKSIFSADGIARRFRLESVDPGEHRRALLPLLARRVSYAASGTRRAARVRRSGRSGG